MSNAATRPVAVQDDPHVRPEHIYEKPALASAQFELDGLRIDWMTRGKIFHRR